jgi:hypothetical protein
MYGNTVGIGNSSLSLLTSGNQNVAFGNGALWANAS